MSKLRTNYPNFVALLQTMRLDNGQIFLDTIEAKLASLTVVELSALAAGEEQDRDKVMTRLGHNEAKALDVILNAAFDGV